MTSHNAREGGENLTKYTTIVNNTQNNATLPKYPYTDTNQAQINTPHIYTTMQKRIHPIRNNTQKSNNKDF